MRIRTSATATSKHGKQPEPEINVTPLVDVVLVLLIIFMVIAPNLQEGTPVVLPEVSKVDEEKLEDALEVVLDDKGQFLLEDKVVTKAELFETLAAVRSKEPERPLILKAHAALPYGTVREAFASLQKVGFGTVALKVDACDEDGKS
ncbi:MAG: biopolymer transporter ExbD [Polyangiaceae bacterium]|nr:biopolymer transporter ExbD [Polyangiaceae bacterium]